MTQEEMIKIASVAVAKNITDLVWDFVEEAENIGRLAFIDKYSHVKLFHSF